MAFEALSTFYAEFPEWVIIIILVWTLIWKGIALWISARKKHVVWFIVMLVVNLLGIIEILYIFIFSKLGKKPATVKQKPTKTAKTATKRKARRKRK